MVGLTSTISQNTLNESGLKTPIKSKRLSEWAFKKKKKPSPNYMLPIRNTL